MHLVSRLLATEHLLQWPGRTMTSRDDVTTTPVEGPACRQIDDGVDKPISQRAAAAAAAEAGDGPGSRELGRRASISDNYCDSLADGRSCRLLLRRTSSDINEHTARTAD